MGTDVVAHVDGDGNVDPSSGITIEPGIGDFPDSRLVRDGMTRRWYAVFEGRCACGGELVLSNRRQRRDWTKNGLPAWDGLVYHERGCPAVDERTRVWAWRNRRLAQ